MTTIASLSAKELYCTAILATCSFGMACRSAAPIPLPIEQPITQPRTLGEFNFSEQTLSNLKEAFVQIAAADKSSAPYMQVGISRYFAQGENIRIPQPPSASGIPSQPILVNASNFESYKLNVFSLVLEERLQHNPELAALFDRYRRDPSSCTRIEEAVVRGVRSAPDDLVVAFREALKIFSENEKPLGTIQDLRFLLTMVNQGDGEVMHQIENARSRIRNGATATLNTTNSQSGVAERITINSENLAQYSGVLNMMLFKMRAEGNTKIQELLKLEEYGELNPIERVVLVAIRTHPDDTAQTYNQAESLYLALLAAQQK